MFDFFTSPLGKEILGGTAALILFASYVPYLIGIRKGKVRPHSLTWFLWAFLCAILFLIQVEEGAGAGAWLTGIDGLVCFYIALVSMKDLKKYVSLSDWASFLIALVALIVWVLADHVNFSVFLLSCVSFFGFYPTYRKAFHHPQEERAYLFLSSIPENLLQLSAMGTLSFATCFSPAFDIVLCLGLVFLLFWRRALVQKRSVLPLKKGQGFRVVYAAQKRDAYYDAAICFKNWSYQRRTDRRAFAPVTNQIYSGRR